MAKYCENCGHLLEDNAEFCDACGSHQTRPFANPPVQQWPAGGSVCPHCGAELKPADQFCKRCGAARCQPQQTQPMPYAPAQAPYAPPPPVKAKSKAGLIAGIVLGCVALAAAAVIGVVLISGNAGKTAVAAATSTPPSSVVLVPFPDELKAKSDVTVHCTYTPPEYIIPANYRSLESVIEMKCYADSGKTTLLVSVEIPEFTQKYEQMVDVTRSETLLKIHPALLEGVAASLKTSRDAQLVVTVKDMNSNKTVLQDTKPVKLYSSNDMQWTDKDGVPYYENILAWVTPEAPEIDQMLRASADSLSDLTNGQMGSIVGYQEAGDLSHEQITYVQVAAIMYTMAAKYNVKYIMAPFSSTDSALQSIKTPAEVLSNASGLCVETVVTMASAIRRMNMHAVIILLPGHAQVAVETWYNSGEYLLIETTALDSARAAINDNGKWDSIIAYLTKDEWAKYLAQDGYVAIDCDLAEKLNIKSIN